MRICIDFDDTIFARNGKIIFGAKEIINKWYEKNQITIFTNRPDYHYHTVKGILDLAKIKYHRIICGKPSYDLFIDDKAIGFNGWKELNDFV